MEVRKLLAETLYRLCIIVGQPGGERQTAYFLLDVPSGQINKLGDFESRESRVLWTRDDQAVLIATSNEVLVISTQTYQIINKWQHSDIRHWVLSPDGSQLALNRPEDG